MVSAASSALWPVATLLQPSSMAPLSNACLRKTPQKVHVFFAPVFAAISSRVYP